MARAKTHADEPADFIAADPASPAIEDLNPRIDALEADLQARIVALAKLLPVAKPCKDCHGWRLLPNTLSFGQCLPSGRGLQAPLMRGDMDTCSLWPAESFKGRK